MVFSSKLSIKLKRNPGWGAGVLEELQMKLCSARLQKALQKQQIQGIASNATATITRRCRQSPDYRTVL